MQTERDFSGTIVRFKYVQEYFREHHREKISPVEDTQFMNYLETIIDFVEITTPNVFRRIKEGKSAWQIEVADLINGHVKTGAEMQQTIKELMTHIKILEGKLEEKERQIN